MARYRWRIVCCLPRHSDDKGLRVSLHIYEAGRHGIGLGATDHEKLHPWTDQLMFWFKQRKFIP